MLTLETTAQFRRDYRRVKKRGYKMALLAEVLDALLAEEPLLPKHRPGLVVGIPHRAGTACPCCRADRYARRSFR